MIITTRKEAIAAGVDTYFTGKPCRKGHIAKRRVSGSCCECAKISWKKYAKARPNEIKANLTAWKKANPEKVASHAKKHRKANQAKENLRIYKWQASNPAKAQAIRAKRRAAKLRATPPWADHAAIGMIYRAAEVIRTTGFDVHVDHVVPLQGRQVTGLHVHNNLRVIKAEANRSKSNHF